MNLDLDKSGDLMSDNNDYMGKILWVDLDTGWEMSDEEINMVCERVAAMRQAYNLCESMNAADFKLPGRAIGNSLQEEGPVAGVTVDVDTMVSEYYEAMDWDPVTGKPNRNRLIQLGLEDIAKDIWS